VVQRFVQRDFQSVKNHIQLIFCDDQWRAVGDALTRDKGTDLFYSKLIKDTVAEK
jgi:hypothetical protein